MVWSDAPITYATSRLSPGVSSRAITTACATQGCQQCRLDLARLDAEAADLHLTVETADAVQRAVRKQTSAVAGAVKACTGFTADGRRARTSPQSMPHRPDSQAASPIPPMQISPGTPIGRSC